MCESTDYFERDGDMLTCGTCNTSFGIGPAKVARVADRYSEPVRSSERVTTLVGDLSSWLPRALS